MNSGILHVDTHGMNCYQARVALLAALKKSTSVYRIEIVHGFHGGTAVRDMIRSEFAAHPLVSRIDVHLDGVTVLILREL